MTAPLVILVLGSALALAAYLVRARGGVPWAIAAGGSLLLGAVAMGVLLGEPFEVLGFGFRLEPTWTFLGRSLALRPEYRGQVGFVFLAGSILLVAGWAANAPRRLPSMGMLILLALSAAIMVQPFIFSPTFIAAAAILSCLTVVRADGRTGRAPPRLMVSYTLGMMAILIAGWLIETGGATASPESPARAASILLSLGLAILVISPPFHTWLTSASDEAHPLAFVFVAVLLQTAGLLLLVNSLASYPWMRSDPAVYSFLRGVGVLMIGLGGLWCLAERRAARIVAYLLLVDAGVSLLALGQGTASGMQIALGLASVRPLSAAVWAAGAANLFGAVAGHGSDLRPIRPACAAAALIGAFSLAGVPLLGGFPGRWLTLSIAQGSDLVALAAVLFGMASSWYAVGRWGWSLARHPAEAAQPIGRARQAILLAGSSAVVLLGLFPGWLFAWGLPALGVLGAG
jgi:formate hydrogenlyase subunit 3/multisubunit Na+/H+ antiporter MnhD subunit